MRKLDFPTLIKEDLATLEKRERRVFESLEAVETAVIEAVKPYLTDGSWVKKLTFYGWLDNKPI